MKRKFLILMVAFPVALYARQTNPVPVNDPINTDSSVQETASPTIENGDLPLETSLDASAMSTLGDASPSPPTKSGNQASARPASSEAPAPEIGGSMVGYIDNAIIGSEVRLRFDAGFHDNFPDNGEFFYAKCGCYKILGGDYAFDPNAPGPSPGVATNLNFQQLYLRAEYAPTKRFSVFTEVPFRWIQPLSFVPGVGTFSNQSGISDVSAGVKVAILESSNRVLTAQLEGTFPSGDASKGLGTNHYVFTPELLFYQGFSERLALEGEVGDSHPIGGSAGVPVGNGGFAADIFYYGVGPSYTLYQAESFKVATVLEMVGWHEFGGFETVWLTGSDIANSVNGTNILNFKLGIRTSFGHSSIYAGYGTPVTHDHWYKGIVRVEYRYYF
jgi:hypothetical protein